MSIDPQMQARLNEIPHLSLNLNYDLELLQNEASRVVEYIGYETRYGNKEKYRHAWKGRSLIGYDRDSKDGMYEHTPDYSKLVREQQLQLVFTDLAEQCPYIMSVVQDLDAHHNRARLMMINCDSSLSWHSHAQNHHQPQSQMTVHVPIIMPEGFSYEVTPKDNMHWTEGRVAFKPLDKDRIWKEVYPEGQATCFNSYHYHNVFNRNPTIPRISIMVYMNLSRDKPRRLFEDAVTRYTGDVVR